MPSPVASSSAERLTTNHIERGQRIFSLPRSLRLWHLASLDAPTVAVVWTLTFAWAGRRSVSLWTMLLVAVVTWCAYVADRLLDARRGLREATHDQLRERHFFHWRHRGVLLKLAIIGAGAAIGIFTEATPPIEHARGSLLAAAALAYFSRVHSTRRPLLLRWPRSFPGKELLVGVLFTAGCVAAAWGAASRLTTWRLWLPPAGFAGLAWLNCTAIARWESGSASTVVRIFALGLAAIEMNLSLFTAGPAPRSAALLAAAAMSALLLAAVDCVRTRMTPLAVRCAADLALLTPVPLFVFAWVLR